MLARARDRDVTVVEGVAEALPFRDDAFDVVLLVTTICFVDDVAATFAEAARVLDADGVFVLGYIDRDSPVGQRYQAEKDENPFYRDATFVATEEVVAALDDAGFTDREFAQTVFEWPGDLTEPDRVEQGYGEGSFVGVAART
jgi:SAM-dependent methyltransferase